MCRIHLEESNLFLLLLKPPMIPLPLRTPRIPSKLPMGNSLRTVRARRRQVSMRSGCMGTACRSAVVLMSRKIKMAASCMTRPPSLTRRANRSRRLCSTQGLMMHSVLRQVNLKETEKPISTWSASPISQTTAACCHIV